MRPLADECAVRDRTEAVQQPGRHTHVECGGKHPPITITAHTKHNRDTASVEVVLKGEMNLQREPPCGLFVRKHTTAWKQREELNVFVTHLDLVSLRTWHASVSVTHSLELSLLPDGAYQPSLRAGAEKGPRMREPGRLIPLSGPMESNIAFNNSLPS